MTDKFTEEPPKISRRDFFKEMWHRGKDAGKVVVGAGVTAALVKDIENMVSSEMSKNPHLENGLKVTQKLIDAEISRDPERITESRKLAMIWLFAETTIKYSKDMGLGGAGSGVEHYLYGNGSTIDISPLLKSRPRQNLRCLWAN